LIPAAHSALHNSPRFASSSQQPTSRSTSAGLDVQWIHSPYEPVEAYTVAINTDGGVELTFGQPQLQVITVAGYGCSRNIGLIQLRQNDCIVEVDVASRGQCRLATSITLTADRADDA
jgi:hypothetical protein